MKKNNAIGVSGTDVSILAGFNSIFADSCKISPNTGIVKIYVGENRPKFADRLTRDQFFYFRHCIHRTLRETPGFRHGEG